MQKLIYTFFALGILHCIPCYARNLVSSEDEWIPGQPCYGPDDIPYATDGYVQEDYVIIRCDCGSESNYGTLSHVYHTGACDSRGPATFHVKLELKNPIYSVVTATLKPTTKPSPATLAPVI